MNINAKSLTITCLLACSGAAASRAQDSVQLNNFRAAETAEDGFAVSRPLDSGHLNVGVQLHVDYAMNPLVFEESRGDAATERQALVADQWVGNAGVWLGLWHRLVLFAGLPINIAMSGQDRAGYPGADGSGLSDVWVGARVRLFGDRHDTLAAALQTTAYAPTADYSHPAQRWSGDIGWAFRPEIALELRFGAGIRLTANAGVHLRTLERAHVTTAAGQELLNVGHEFVWAAGLTIPVVREQDRELFSIYLEAYGRNTLINWMSAPEDFISRDTTTGETLLGLKAEPGPGFYVGLAGGTGILRGYGAPDLRLIGTIGYAPPIDRAGTADTPSDSDGDGVPDAEDACPTDPEDLDGFEDGNGCPDPDNDQDGVLDASDRAPNDPEDHDGFEDDDGAPELDNDRDGVLDASDRAPNDPEDHDGFQDLDGVPEPDNDQDNVLDRQDHCPLDPGPESVVAEANGCPRTVRVDRETGRILILERVEFANDRDTILQRSYPILEEVRSVLAANLEIALVRIEGHTDDRGNDAHNLDLSRRRARSVRAWLAGRGIDPSRMIGAGCGETHPLESNRTNDGRQANRRVEFHILNPAPATETHDTTGCVDIN